MSIIDILRLPEAKEIVDLDDPETALIHKKIIKKKKFLRRLYLDFYNSFKKLSKDAPPGLMVEIGSGSSFLKEEIKDLITSDIFQGQDIDLVFDAIKMPFKDSSVSVFFLLNVLHHIKNPIAFFDEANRCLSEHGKIIMIEPYNSLWSKFIYTNFHHEPFFETDSWEIKGDGRLTNSNQALPWMIFFRDRLHFENKFPSLKIKLLKPHNPILYIISGGLSIRQLLPDFMYDVVKVVEMLLSPLSKYTAMFFTVEIEKVKI